MFHFGTKDLADRARIRIVAITGHLARNLPCNGDSATKEPLGRRHVARRTEHRVDEIAFTIDRTIQVTPFALNLHVCLINIPASPNLTFTFATQLLSKQRREALFPLPYRFVREFVATHQKHADEVAQAELEQ